MKHKGIILLSGGLDSYVSLALARKICDIELALIFDYGQEVFEEEFEAASAMSKKFGIKHKVIKLDFLSEMLDKKEVWVPNRNGLFLNIAASYADRYDINYIIIGANKEEAMAFSDNTSEFLSVADVFFNFSTKKHPKILSPLRDKTKVETVNIAIEENLDFSLIKSCYKTSDKNGKKHCGKCASCLYLKGALEKCSDKNLIKKFF